MRKLFMVLASIFAMIGVIFIVLPTEKLGLIPIALSLIFGLLAMQRSEVNQKAFPRLIVIFAIILMFVGLAKTFLLKDEVVIDKQDEIQKVESQKQDLKDLEELDGL